MPVKTQRVRDPLHDIIRFDAGQFEDSLWQVIQTPQFQRLRRIRQLGFSELTFPGATHTRFSHSIGVFETARRLMGVIRQHIESGNGQFGEHESKVALAAALVHDVGHGMFSHTFEEVGKRLGLEMMRHETISERLIKDSEISVALKRNGGEFADDVATMIGRDEPETLYDAVVSGQFDADRLDYMQRDRLMAGVRSGGIDFPWLVENLEVGHVAIGVDDSAGSSIETFVLGPKSVMAAEQYVLALFQLYPTIYFHKATRAAEKMFVALMERVITMIHDGSREKTGLPENHPFVRFANAPDSLESVLALDDAVFWGALGMLTEASDTQIAKLANRIQTRKLPKCTDIRAGIEGRIPIDIGANFTERRDRSKNISQTVEKIKEILLELAKSNAEFEPRLFLDEGKRDPYSRGKSKGLLNRIRIREQSGNISDIADYSRMIAALDPFEFFRAYVYSEDTEAQDVVHRTISESVAGSG